MINRIRIAIIGVGHIYPYYRNAIICNRLMFELIGVYDKYHSNLAADDNLVSYKSLKDMFDDKPDIVAILTPSSAKHKLAIAVIRNKISVILEKPQASSTQELNNILSIAKKKGVFVYGAFHSLFTSTHIRVRKLLTKNGKSTRHIEHGDLIKIELDRFDPYYEDGKFYEFLPEQSSALDSLPNILAELYLFTNEYTIHNSLNLTPSHLNSPMEIRSQIQGLFNRKGFFIGRTNWTNGVNSKITTLRFEDDYRIEIDHTRQIIKEGFNELIVTADLNLIGERMTLEYIRMFQNVYEVFHGIKPSNEEFTIKNLSETLLCMEWMKTS